LGKNCPIKEILFLCKIVPKKFVLMHIVPKRKMKKESRLPKFWGAGFFRQTLFDFLGFPLWVMMG